MMPVRHLSMGFTPTVRECGERREWMSTICTRLARRTSWSSPC